MNFTLENIIHLLEFYKYWIIFPLGVFEGPIITIISGFLSSIGHLNFWVAWFVLMFADLFSDTLYYCLGRYGREKFILRFGRRLGLTVEHVITMEKYFKNHPWKIFIFGKVAHGTGSTILTAAGLARVPYFQFLKYNIPTTLGNTSILIVIGYYFGHAYSSINKYFDYASLFFVAALVVAYIYFIKRAKKSLE
jgi:membrane protein DedA with SNARE-associated domain